MWGSRIKGPLRKQLKTFSKIFGYSFRKLDLLHNALTHRSYAHEQGLNAESHNERLEFLGDAVLELAISELLMARFPQYSEGDLSKLRAAIVNEKQLAVLATEYRVGEFLFLGRGEAQSQGREKPSLLADAYEAILGAAYLDRGYKKIRKVIEKHYLPILEQGSLESLSRDYKTELQEKVQGRFRTIPQYRLVGEQGPDHRKSFEVEIFIKEQSYGRGLGFSKKSAEQNAAELALRQLLSEGEVSS